MAIGLLGRDQESFLASLPPSEVRRQNLHLTTENGWYGSAQIHTLLVWSWIEVARESAVFWMWLIVDRRQSRSNEQAPLNMNSASDTANWDM